jgi:hypothetical protein
MVCPETAIEFQHLVPDYITIEMSLHKLYQWPVQEGDMRFEAVSRTHTIPHMKERRHEYFEREMGHAEVARFPC